MKLIKKSTPPNLSPQKEAAPQPAYSDLSSVINKKVPFELIYSGVENDSYYDVLYECGVRNFLMSYHYIQNKHINLDKRFLGQDIRLFIDSGAHTYQNDPKYAEVSVEEWEEHLKKYLRWAERNKEHLFAIASFDFENLVSPEIVDRWNRTYFEPFMLKTGIPVCFVWHQNSYKTWEQYCQRYPYVGFSSVNTEGVAIDLDEYRDKLRIAEKHDSVVHGFGMTRTSMLTQLPFYTSDSTTWLVGLQYGEMNYWKDTKMSRLKKDAWKNTYLHDICTRYGLDQDKLLEEDVTEVIKANVYAFIDAEKFIQERLRSSMYWLKAKTQKLDLNALPKAFFPPMDWFREEKPSPEPRSYAMAMNINPDLPEEELINFVSDVTVFFNWNSEEYADLQANYTEEVINNIHDLFINRIVGSPEEKITDLISFYRSNVSGESDKLLQYGTNFDRTVRERESYIDDTEEELVDLSPEELKVKLYGLLPAPSDVDNEEGAPEIDKLDEEIFRQADIVPTFDSKGKFVKGQTRVRKPKKVYSKKYPKYACDTCYAAAKCPEYKAGFVCAYNKLFNRFDTRDMGDIIQAMQGMTEHNLARMQRAMVMETINGNFDPGVSGMIDQNMRLLSNLKQMYDSGSKEVLRQTRVVRADGSQEETTQITNPQSGGVLERLFGGMTSEDPKTKKESGDTSDAIDIEGRVVQKNARYEKSEDDDD